MYGNSTLTRHSAQFFRVNDNDNTITSREIANNSLYAFLKKTEPEFITVVPEHWLNEEKPVRGVQFWFAVLFLIVCIPGSISQLLVFLAYSR